jgi:hypothetical protein
MSGSSGSGLVSYEAMTNAQKAELSAYLREQLAQEATNLQWHAEMRRLVKETMARRAASGASMDAGDVIAEVMPLVRAAIPASVREGLFRRVVTQLNATQ